MLRLYGSVVVGLDATYKTNLYNYNLFLLLVYDNFRKGQLVGMFATPNEKTPAIAAALSVLKEWNPIGSQLS